MLFTSKNLVHNIKDVPETWIFEHFFKLKEKLVGQTLKIKSFICPVRSESLAIYYNNEINSYRFKCFSSGKAGNAIELVKLNLNISSHSAISLIIESYNDFILHNNGGYDVKEFKEATKYKVVQYQFRTWTTQDQYFWTQFNIGSKLLNHYCVKPLSSYTMERTIDGETKNLTINGNYIYGYFTKDGNLYKIYQPKTLDKKFIKVDNYIQGWDQCKEENKFLLIVSSLKDIMSIRSLKLQNIDIIAPDSESTGIKKEHMNVFNDLYEKILIMFDNDDAGIKSMMKHKEKYPYIECILLDMAKDPSDSIKQFGTEKVMTKLVPLIQNKING